MYALINSEIYTGHQILQNHAVIISGGVIKDIHPIYQLSKNIKTYNLFKSILAPGFIDLQINGCGGVQFSDNTKSISLQTLQTMQVTNRRYGCTSFLPTLITSSDILIKQAIQVIRAFINNNSNQILGLHLEGPFLNPNKKGIHNSSLIRLPTKEIINYLCNNNDIVKKITLAPETLNTKVIETLKKAGIYISIGHSNATYQETKSSFSFGITCGTHLFNAMPPLTAREPGVIGAIFDFPDVYCSIIADGIHVHWSNIKYSKKIKGKKIILITDGTSPSGCENVTHFTFAGKTIFYKDKKCTNIQGILSGSSLTMIQAIQNAVKYSGIPLDEALRMATLYPAKMIGVDHYLGSLEINKIANLTVFNQKYQIQKTIVNGKIYDISTES